MKEIKKKKKIEMRKNDKKGKGKNEETFYQLESDHVYFTDEQQITFCDTCLVFYSNTTISSIQLTEIMRLCRAAEEQTTTRT